MFFRQTLPFIDEFVTTLDLALQEYHPKAKLSRKQKAFLSFCLMGTIVTNSIFWARFERASLGDYKIAALSWMFRHAPIPWEKLLNAGISAVIQKYKLTEGVLVADDTDNQRAKKTTRIAYSHKVYDKKTGGYFNGQSLVFLLLVTPKVTIPVGFSFYTPDPALQIWDKEEERLKKQGIPKKERPVKPERAIEHPTKVELAEGLIRNFREAQPNVQVKAFTGDNLYSTGPFMEHTRSFLGCQVIGSMKQNQKVKHKEEELAVSEYFRRNPPTEQTIRIRGGKEVTVFYHSARLYVPSHGVKRLVVALRYEEQDEWRYLCASDLGWRTIDIVEAWTLRWLVEVFIEDFKVDEGWGQLAKQQGVEGAFRGVLVSLLLDLALILHPQQEARLKAQEPALTVGSLLRLVRAEALMVFLKSLLVGKTGYGKLEEMSQKIAEIFELQPSTKHMSGRTLGRLEPTPSLQRHALVS